MADDIKIDVQDYEKYALALRTLHRSLLPNTVRFTLNDMAHDMKTKSISEVANREFTIRNKSFMSANSRFTKAKGYNINQMQAEAGITDRLEVGERLAKQEDGGRLDHSFVPLKGARGKDTSKSSSIVSKGDKRRVSRRFQGRNIKFLNANKTKGNKKTKLVRSAIMAKKHNLSLVHSDVVWNVTNLRRTKKGTRFKLKPLYSYKKGRDVRVQGTGFISKSGELSQSKALKFFKKNSKKQMEKFKMKNR